VFFPGQVKGSGLQRLAASLIKVEEKIPPPVLLRDRKQAAFKEHVEISGCKTVPSTQGNSALERGRAAASAAVLSTRTTAAPCGKRLLGLPRSALHAVSSQPTGHAHVGSPARELPENYA